MDTPGRRGTLGVVGLLLGVAALLAAAAAAVVQLRPSATGAALALGAAAAGLGLAALVVGVVALVRRSRRAAGAVGLGLGLVALIGGAGAAGFAATSAVFHRVDATYGLPSIATGEYTVVYRVTGDGPRASLEWGAIQGTHQQDLKGTKALPFTDTQHLRITGVEDVAAVSIVGLYPTDADGDPIGHRFTCSITANGRTIAHATAKGEAAFVSCQANIGIPGR